MFMILISSSDRAICTSLDLLLPHNLVSLSQLIDFGFDLFLSLEEFLFFEFESFTFGFVFIEFFLAFFKFLKKDKTE